MKAALAGSKSFTVISRVFLLRLLCILLLSPAPVLAAQSDTQFDRLIATLNEAPFEARQAFASLALSRLVDAYLAEVDQVRSDPRNQDGAQLRWSRSVEQYVNRLLLLKSDIDMGLDVAFSAGSSLDAVIEAGGQSVMLSYPRLREQRAFEQSLVEAFCRARMCETLAAVDTPRMLEPVVVEVRPEWTFAANRIECRHRGVSLVFAVREYSDRLRQFCNAVFREAETLSGELRKLAQFGMVIEWGALSIRPATTSSEQVVEVNAARDSVPLRLPTLSTYPRLLALLQPWLQAQLEHQVVTLTLKAADFGWHANSTGSAATVGSAG